MSTPHDNSKPVTASDLFGGLRPLVKGDTVQRGDIFIDDGQRYGMNNTGICMGVHCLGRTIIKENGGWHRPTSSWPKN